MSHDHKPLPDKPSSEDESLDFIRTLVTDDLATGKHGGRVATRFPPEPNGYLHIGHAKSICLNFGVAEEFGGTCNLRFDDTNPETEDPEYVRSIQHDVRWLGFDWQDRLHFASDYFEQLHECALRLIRDGKAYVDSLSGEEIREYRGTVTEAGRPSPYRDRTVEENLDLFARMRAGEFDDGTHVLRARIDMAANNMLMRDPVLYRIRKKEHYRRGDAWCIYPLYDFTHCLSDAFEGITHSLCTLEFDNNRELYDWVIEHAWIPSVEGKNAHRPEQTEFARLNLNYTLTSKRKLLQLVEEGHVSGWDDPRMATLSGLRRRGYTPESIRDFCDRVGVAKKFNVIDIALLEYSIRDDLNTKVPRGAGRAASLESGDRELSRGSGRGARRALLSARRAQGGLPIPALWAGALHRARRFHGRSAGGLFPSRSGARGPPALRLPDQVRRGDQKRRRRDRRAALQLRSGHPRRQCPGRAQGVRHPPLGGGRGLRSSRGPSLRSSLPAREPRRGRRLPGPSESQIPRGADRLPRRAQSRRG